MEKRNVEEMDFLKDWMITILKFIQEKEQEHGEISQDDQTINNELISNINQAYEKKNLKALKSTFGSINEWISYYRSEDLKKINKTLKDKFGFDLNDKNQNNLIKIKSIIKRGCVKTASEYRLLSNRVEQIYADEDKVDELEALNRLLFDFDSKHEPVND